MKMILKQTSCTNAFFIDFEITKQNKFSYIQHQALIFTGYNQIQLLTYNHDFTGIEQEISSNRATQVPTQVHFFQVTSSH